MQAVSILRQPQDATTPSKGEFSHDVLQRAIRRFAGPNATVMSVRPLASDRGGTELKQVGYGEPLLVTYKAADGPRQVVFRTMLPNWFGHDRRADRASMAILAADTYGNVSHHVRVLDVGAVAPQSLVSLHDAGEFYLITQYEPGTLYAQDLRAIEKSGFSTLQDMARQHALCRYLTDLHSPDIDSAPQVYARAIRDLLGSGEGIFGIVDSYPAHGPISVDRLFGIERRCLDWRHRLRDRHWRLRRTHGDFHPYNILFRQGLDFTVLDASRGGVGDPADDVAAMTINYFFGGVIAPSSWQRGMKPLWNGFWQTYLTTTNDEEILEIVAPFFAWRALVLASPVWYPGISANARNALLSFAETVLDAPCFSPDMADRFVG